MTEELIAALSGVVIAVLGWFGSWIRSKSKSKVIGAIADAVEKVDSDEVKAAIDSAVTSKGVKSILDRVLKAKGYVSVVLAGLVLSGCGLLSSGTSGAGGELGAATATGNFYIFSLSGPAKAVIGEDGKVVVSAEGGVESPPGIVLVLGREAIGAKTSSGGENAGATQTGGSGDITPTIPIPGLPK